MSGQYQERLGRLALGALLTALILRLVWGIAIPVIPMSDSHAYDVFAQNIAQGYGYGWEPHRPTAFWPVGTSAIYGLLYWIFGHSYTPIVLFQVLLGVAIVAIAMSLARRWFGEAVAVVTGWILACWPLLIQYTTILASELFFVFFVLLAFWTASVPGRSWFNRAVFSGIALAAASYVRPIALIMAPLLFMKDMKEDGRRVRSVLACVVAVIMMFACILPWSIRNWHALDRFVLVSTNGGANLWMGNNPNSDGGYMRLPELDIANEADRDNLLARQAKDYILQEPTAFLVRMVKKVIKLHDRESIGVVWNEKGIAVRAGQGMLSPLKLVSSAYWWAILAAAIYGVFLYARRRGLWLLLMSPPIMTWLYFTLVHVVTVAGDRYHVPSIPFIAMIAAYGLAATGPVQAIVAKAMESGGRPRAS